MGKWMQRKLFMGGRASFFLGLGLLTVCFLIGMLGGRASAGKNSESALSELHRYLTGYYALDAVEERGIGIFLNALFIYFRYPLLAFFMGLTIPGTLLLPLLSAAFGFFLSYAACCGSGTALSDNPAVFLYFSGTGTPRRGWGSFPAQKTGDRFGAMACVLCSRCHPVGRNIGRRDSFACSD